jgi:hypothetical protein
MPSAEDVARLQGLFLRATLLGIPLPGSSQPIRFPDLSFVTEQPSIFLIDQNLAGPIEFSGGPKPLRILSVDAMRKEGEQRGEVAYLQFAPPQINDDEVGLTLAARISARTPAVGDLGLSAIHARFRNVGGHWQLAQEPVVSAA